VYRGKGGEEDEEAVFISGVNTKGGGGGAGGKGRGNVDNGSSWSSSSRPKDACSHTRELSKQFFDSDEQR